MIAPQITLEARIRNRFPEYADDGRKIRWPEAVALADAAARFNL
jgi:hypothetical protein